MSPLTRRYLADCSDSSPSSYITDDDDENGNALGTEEAWNPEDEDETGGEDEDNECECMVPLSSFS